MLFVTALAVSKDLLSPVLAQEDTEEMELFVLKLMNVKRNLTIATELPNVLTHLDHLLVLVMMIGLVMVSLVDHFVTGPHGLNVLDFVMELENNTEELDLPLLMNLFVKF
jgi:hypothetical protein